MSLLIALLFVGFTISAQTPDEILTQYYENIGGVEAWKNLNSMKMSGKSSMQGMEFPITIYSKRPNYEKLEIEVQGMQIVQAYDGTTAWAINPFQGDTKPTKADDETNAESAKKTFEDELIDYAAKGHTVELLEDQEIEGAPTYQVKLKKKNGDEQIYFFDKENYVPIMIKSFVNYGPMKGQAVETYLSDYEEVEGIIVPMSMTQKVNGQVFMQGTMESVELNSEIEDAIFAFPGLAEETPVAKETMGDKKIMEEKEAMQGKGAEMMEDGKKEVEKDKMKMEKKTKDKKNKKSDN